MLDDPATTRKRRAAALVAVLPILLVGCGTMPPTNVENICAIFEEKGRWYKDAKKSEKRWGADRDDFGDAIDFVGWWIF